MTKCKNKGPCICGKKEQYLFTPHLTEKEEAEIYGVVFNEEEEDYEYLDSTHEIDPKRMGDSILSHLKSSEEYDYEDLDYDFYVPLQPKAVYRLKVSKVTKIL